MTDDAYREFAKDGVTQFSRRPLDEQAWPSVRRRCCSSSTRRSTASRRLAPLGARLDIIEHEARAARQSHLLPRRAADAVRADREAARARALRRARAVTPITRSRGSSSRSRSAAISTSARAINDAIAEVFDERQIYRIDHYLGKETVQNILVLRFANSIFEPLFNQKYVDHVQITVAEEEGVGTRAGYYEQAGALRDMVQNHMLQLLCAGRDGAAALARRRRRPRREARGAAVAAADSTATAVDANVVRGAVRRRASTSASRCRATARRTGVDPQLAHRDLRRAAGLHRQLALGRRAVLPAHRQAPAQARQRDLGPPQGRAADPVQRRPGGARSSRTSCRSAFSRTRGSRSASARRSRGRDVRIYPVKMDFHYGSTFGGIDARGLRAAAARRDGRRRRRCSCGATRSKRRGTG